MIVLAVLATIFGSIHMQLGRSCGMTSRSKLTGACQLDDAVAFEPEQLLCDAVLLMHLRLLGRACLRLKGRGVPAFSCILGLRCFTHW